MGEGEGGIRRAEGGTTEKSESASTAFILWRGAGANQSNVGAGRRNVSESATFVRLRLGGSLALPLMATSRLQIASARESPARLGFALLEHVERVDIDGPVHFVG